MCVDMKEKLTVRPGFSACQNQAKRSIFKRTESNLEKQKQKKPNTVCHKAAVVIQRQHWMI